MDPTSTVCPVYTKTETRGRIDLCGVWKHQINTSAERPDESGAWEDYEVPGWRSAVRKDVPYFLWFRRGIEIPADWQGKRVVLNLRGARNTPKVFVDGRLAGSKFDGWTPFELDITDFVRPGCRHTLDLCCGDRSAVEDLTKSTDEIAHTIAPVGGFHDNCGPFLPVYFDAYDPLHFEDSRLAIVTSVRNMTVSVTGAVVHAAGTLPDASFLKIECAVLDGETPVLTFGGVPQFGEVRLSDAADDAAFDPGAWRFEAAFPGAKLWTPETPDLYRLRIRLYANGALRDESFTRFGFREVWCDGPDFFLNGVKRRLLASSTWPAYGYIPREIAIEISRLLEVPLAKIYGVVTFYNFFRLQKAGKYNVQVCLGTACYLRGGDDLIKEFERQLGVGLNATTKDGLFSVEAVRCLGCCGLAPVAVVNGEVHGKLEAKDVERIIKIYRERG